MTTNRHGNFGFSLFFLTRNCLLLALLVLLLSSAGNNAQAHGASTGNTTFLAGKSNLSGKSGVHTAPGLQASASRDPNLGRASSSDKTGVSNAPELLSGGATLNGGPDPVSQTEASTQGDFTVSVSPSSMTLVVGTGGNSSATVTVTPINGFTGDVTLSTSGSGGIGSSVSPTVVTLGNAQTSSLTISVPTSTSSGSYPLTITGTSGALSHSATFTVNISDFSLSASPNPMTVPAGFSQSTTVAVAGVYGFNSSVSLSASGFPPGASVSFTPPTVTGPGSTTMTFSTPVDTPPGIYNITITGTCGSLTHSTQFTLTVVDFSLSVSPNVLTMRQGLSGNATVTVTGINGFTGIVSLSASGQTGGLPPGVTAMFAPPSVAATGTSTLTLTVSSSATPGIYTIILGGTNNGSTLTIPMTLNVTDFVITPGSDLITIPPGSSKNATISLTPFYGFTGSAALSVAGLPNGMTVTFVPASASSGSPSTLTINVASTVVQGTYKLTVSGVADSIIRTTTFSVDVDNTTPVVTPTFGNLQDVYVGIPATATATATVAPLPGGYSASDLVATWSYQTSYIDYSLTGADGTWNDPGDSSTASVALNGSATDPTGTFTGTFNTEGLYEACIVATVSFRNPTTGQNFGPYSGYGFETNDGYTGSAAAAAPSTRSAAAMPVRPRQLSAGTPPAGSTNGKITVRLASATITIPQLNDTTKLIPGGLVVLNADGNGAPAQKIFLGVTHGKVGQSLKVTFNWTRAGTGVVQVYDPDTKLNLTYNNIDNVFYIKPESPKTLYVSGFSSGSVATGITGFSRSMGDVILAATAGNHTDTANVTVLWVDTPNFAQKATLPAYDAPQGRVGWMEVVAAKVHPSTFSYSDTPGYYQNSANPNDPINDVRLHLTRDYYYVDWVEQMGRHSVQSQANWTATAYGAGNDTSPSVFRNDYPLSNLGKIDDTDDAGLPTLTLYQNTIMRTRNNFRAWAVVRLITQQAGAVRCSPIMSYINVFSMRNASSGYYNADYKVITPPDVDFINSDLVLDHGITPVSYDLK